MNLNKVLLGGNLTKDIELRYTTGGKAVGNTGIAINKKYKSGEEWKDETTFVNLVVWGKQAEIMAEHLNKGSGVFVEGRIQTRTWEKDKVKHYATEVVVTEFQFIDKKKKEQAQGEE